MSHVVVGYNGPPCCRCGRPTQIREHDRITEKQLQQPFYYQRWFRCINPDCKTTLIMPEEFRVWNDPTPKQKQENAELAQLFERYRSERNRLLKRWEDLKRWKRARYPRVRLSRAEHSET